MNPEPAPLRLRTLALYLIGNRDAVLTLASSRWTLPLGALFVLSAAFARDYDGEDLLNEPWHLLVPFAASVAASLLLFLLACALRAWRSEHWPGWLPAYSSFLGLFWMTAPLAWMYAIPYERLLPPVQAMQANLWTLGVVAVWRVALMMRVLNVVLAYGPGEAFVLVMTFADVMVLVALQFLPFPLLNVMSGTRLSEGQEMMREAAQGVCLLSVCTIPVWFSIVPVVWFTVPHWQAGTLAAARGRPSTGLWTLAFGSVAVWVLFLPQTQAEQQLRKQVETAYAERRFGDMMDVLATHAQEEFPPHWLPPPIRFTDWSATEGPNLLALWDAILARPIPPWVREHYLARLKEMMESRFLSEEDRHRVGALLAKLP